MGIVRMLLLSSLVHKHIFPWIFSRSLFCVARGEYHIKDQQVPSYLYRNFSNVDEAVFPMDIRINVSVTRVSGTLLYSIDRNMNQLILSLYNSKEATLSVEFNKHEFGVSLPQLCGCVECRFEALDIRVLVGDELLMQCNGGTVMRKMYRPSKGVNRDFILPYDNTGSHTTVNNGANLWLVNNPQYGHIYPNNDQMSGCIFKASYCGKDLLFTEVSANVGTQCKKICEGNICHGGRCLETYNDEPVCNCTSTFNNGIYCNDTIHAINARSSYPYHIYNAFKLSWRSSSREILILYNENVNLTLSQESGVLAFECNIAVASGSVMRVTLSEHYKPGHEYILIGTFNDKFINIQISDNTTWNQRTLWTGRDIGSEVFTSVTLRSGDGVIGMVFKTSLQDYHWRNVSMDRYELLEEERKQNRSNACIKPHKYVSNQIIITVAYVLTVVCWIVTTVGFVLYIRRIRRAENRPPPGIPLQNDYDFDSQI